MNWFPLWFVLLIIVQLTLVIGTIAVAIHFILKFW